MESIIDIFPHHRRLKALCEQQTQELSDKGEFIAQLIAENQQLRRNNQILAENAKIAEGKMQQEPRPRAQLDLPCPLLDMPETWDIIYALVGYSYHDNGIPYIKEIKYGLRTENFNALQYGLLFKHKEDAQEWLDAMRKARRSTTTNLL